MLYDGQLEPHGFSFFIVVKISTTVLILWSFRHKKPLLVRVSVNRLNINDKIVEDGEYSIKMYTNTGDATAHFSFEKQPPVQIISGTGETIMTKSAFKGKRAISVSSGKATYE